MRAKVAVLAAVCGVLGVVQAGTMVGAGVVFSDGFESYSAGTGGSAPALDKNYTGTTPPSPNQAANGTGNPWFGPAPPNARVVNAENGVTPFSGTNMIRGSAPSDFDENWVNLAYRFNGGNPYAGGISLDFRFYDPVGSGAGSNNYRDFGALGFYDTAPSNTDYPGTGSLNTNVALIQRLCLGASSDTGGAYDATKYQVRVVGRTDGYNDGTGWFNTPLARTVGWHLGRIEIGPALADNTNLVNFYIDNLVTPVFSSNSITNFGYNVIEMNTNYGSTAGYMDDVVFSTTPVPEPTGVAAASLLGFGALARRRRSA